MNTFECPNCGYHHLRFEANITYGEIFRCAACKTGWSTDISLPPYPEDDDDVCCPEDIAERKTLEGLIVSTLHHLKLHSGTSAELIGHELLISSGRTKAEALEDYEGQKHAVLREIEQVNGHLQELIAKYQELSEVARIASEPEDGEAGIASLEISDYGGDSPR